MHAPASHARFELKGELSERIDLNVFDLFYINAVVRSVVNLEVCMSQGYEGRCLCGKVRYATGCEPLWVTICYCRFCQRATGSGRMVEPIFERAPFTFPKNNPTV